MTIILPKFQMCKNVYRLYFLLLCMSISYNFILHIISLTTNKLWYDLDWMYG